jgi:SNF2 family DNA or RNA helicase
VVLDESQHIKNPTSHIYRSVMRLRADHRLVLTGTPVENSLTDLWTQLNFVNPGLLGSLAFFRGSLQDPSKGASRRRRRSRLRKIIQPFIMRRTKEMVVRELPPVTEQVIHCDMSDEQAAIYEREKSAVRNSILENIESVGIEKSAIIVLQGLMRLRQLANHPVMTDESYSGGSGKFDTVTHNIESVVSEGHRILIFSSFVKHLELFPGWLEKQDIGYTMLTGSTRERGKVIGNFRNDSSKKVFPDLPQGRRRGAEPDRGRLCIHPRPVVEPGIGDPGAEQGAPDRAGKEGVCAQVHLRQHNRGEDTAAAGEENKAGRQLSSMPTILWATLT